MGRLHPLVALHLPADVDLQAGVRRVGPLDRPPKVLLDTLSPGAGVRISAVCVVLSNKLLSKKKKKKKKKKQVPPILVWLSQNAIRLVQLPLMLPLLLMPSAKHVQMDRLVLTVEPVLLVLPLLVL